MKCGGGGAVVGILKNPNAGLGRAIVHGKYRVPLPGTPHEVKAQAIPNVQIGSLKGDPRLGEVNVFLMLTYVLPSNISG